MNDKVLDQFLRRQLEEGMALSGSSDIVRLTPVFGTPPSKYIAAFHCKGLVGSSGAQIREAGEFHFGIAFAPDYLRAVRMPELITVLFPQNVWHPNIIGPAFCAGGIGPGTTLVFLLHQIYEIITYQNWAPHDGLNAAACEWARHNQERFPLESRPLRRRSILRAAGPAGGGTP